MARHWDPWTWVRQNPSLFLSNLVVDEDFLDILYRKQVLQRADEKEWLSTSLDDDYKQKMVLLYTILTSHPNPYEAYVLFQHALSKTQQQDILNKLDRENTPPDRREQDEESSQSLQLQGTPLTSFSFSAPDETLCVVDVIIDETVSTEIQNSERLLRTLLNVKLKTDPRVIEIRVHVVSNVPTTAAGQRKLIIIFPLLEGLERGLSDSLGVEQPNPGEGLFDCHVELILVRGLNHLFKPISEDSPREDYLDNDMPRDLGTFQCFKPEDLEYDNTTDLLQRGKFSDVFRACVPSIDSQAAIKLFKSEASKVCRREYRVFRDVDCHVNIIRLVGICMCMTDVKDVLVLEYAEYGDLHTLLTSHLSDHPDVLSDVDWALRTRMALDVAQGMTIVHKKIVHLDLKTSNVLVGKDYCCKISDFGSAEFPNESENSHFSVHEENTTVFTALERFSGNNHWNWEKQKADVYAYSMILIYLKKLKTPWPVETSPRMMKEKVLAKDHPSLETDDGCPDYILKLIKQCWSHNRKKRPEFQEIDRLVMLSGYDPTEARPPARKYSTPSLSTFQKSRGVLVSSSRAVTESFHYTDSGYTQSASGLHFPVQVSTALASGRDITGSSLRGSPQDKAEVRVSDEELRDVAKEIVGFWSEFAIELDPSLFQLRKNLTAIQGDPRYSSPTDKAQYMLETWQGHHGANATRSWLIRALCKKDNRSGATKVFGQELVDFVCPQPQTQ